MISDDDFIKYYQSIVDYLAYCDDEDTAGSITRPYNEPSSYIWAQKTMDAFWRFLNTHLVGCYCDKNTFLKDMKDDMIEEIKKAPEDLIWCAWGNTSIGTREPIIALANSCGMGVEQRHFEYEICQPLKKELTEIFNTYGVGFDKECPYKVKEN